MPRTTIVEIPPAEQARMLAELRRARYGYLLAVHLLLLCAAGRTPTEIASVLFCSRSTVYRVGRAYRLSRVGFLRGKGHLVYPCQFYIFVRRAGPQFGDETPRGQAPVVEQRHQDSDPALAKHADQAQPRRLALA